MSAGQQDGNFKLNLNGQEVAWSGEPAASLADVIRDQQGLTGTKIGCRTGECGACTVLLEGRPVVSCLIPAASVQGQQVETIEGLARQEEFQSLMTAMQENGGVQCGFCTPGVMVTTWAWLQNPALFNGDLGSALKNNLCRCTGYLGIIRSAEQVLAGRGAGV
ncbi:(2Fe-2S)-binding protein [Paenibacillus physcomitrellae]|uniref:(2Fe-2S)-binding protein n=1 Tax=Paenibacillus physcomitrellae TaxID=1619311 RepID=A0ABQ1FRT0_9BACL|nr:2Fe-2S iron-sulfur cluster-binding protein [Paenibacillus physcomitrellae]GGA26627.1 (2Fe-2S)-binding protein [Paenibacillus physcomitrellae]